MPSVPLCETLYTSHTVLDLTEITEDTEGAEKALKNLCSKLCLSRSPQRPRRGGRQRFKNLCASVRNSLYIPCRFGSHGDHRGHGGGRKSVEKPLCTPCLRAKLFIHPMPFSDLAKIAKDTERRPDVNALKKTSVNSVPPCETLCTTHAVFRSHGDHKVHKGQGEGSRQRFKNLRANDGASVLKLFYITHAVFRSHEKHRVTRIGIPLQNH